ncbi:ATP-binding cassette domain-containing protein [Syntrophotalea acetylenivorans]|uniref:ATP-binding cassette domain-containing protein n=1 Tax=Syntrophotalea acetylenivorans TaxID=1842532 RepID=UPI0009FB7E13|nr:ATP-binding cassette domain-containing protein [Syntrophotalea acetylenivorans]
MSLAGEPVLQIAGLGKVRVNEQGREVTVLRDVDLTLVAGQITVIIGPSGGGKSTLVRLLNRLEEPSSGEILLNGRNIRLHDPLQLRRKVALVAQKPFVFNGSVLDNLQRPFIFQGDKPPAAEDSRLLELLALCQLSAEWLQRDARSLSVGQQQRLCLARSLAMGPEVLLLDEPTSALDRPTVNSLASSLRKACRKWQLAVLLVTHDLHLAKTIADHLAYLEDGCISEQGLPDELFARPRSNALQCFLSEPSKKQV